MHTCAHMCTHVFNRGRCHILVDSQILGCSIIENSICVGRLKTNAVAICFLKCLEDKILFK